MSEITIIDNIGWHEEHIAVFKNGELYLLEKIKKEQHSEFISEIKNYFSTYKCIEINCLKSYKEFVSVNDFPNTLKTYFH